MLLSFKQFTNRVTLWIFCLTFFHTLFAEPVIPLKNRIAGVSGSLQLLIETRLQEIPFNIDVSLPIRLEESKQAIQQILEAYGYFRSNIQSTTQDTPEGKYITYTISKGPQLLITQLSIQLLGDGESNIALQQTAQNLSQQQGKPMTTENYQSIKKTLYQSAVSEGYLDAAWTLHTVAIDLKTYTAKINLILETKPRYTIGSIQFLKSPSPLSETFVKSYLEAKEGKPYQLTQILNSQRSLQESDYFQDAHIEAPITPHHYQVPIYIIAKPASKYYTLLSVGFRTDLGFRAKAEGLIRHLNSQGHQLLGMAQTSRTQFHSLGLYKIPGKSPATQQHHIQLEYKGQYKYSQTNQNSHSIIDYFPTSFSLKHPTGIIKYLFTQQDATWHKIPSISLHYERFQPTEAQAERSYLGLMPSILISKTNSNWSKNKHNYIISSRLDGALGLFASRSFAKFETKSVYFCNLSSWIPLSYLILRGRYGYLWTQSLSDIPTSLRFHAGGYAYPRGHKEYLLGTQTLGGGLEIRKHLMSLLYLNPFFFEMNWDNHHHPIIPKGSAGAGLCLWYPHIGTVEVSAVFRINPNLSQSRFGIIAKISTDIE